MARSPFVIRYSSFSLLVMSLIRLQNISRRYQMGAEVIHALRDVSLEIQRGEYVAIMGPSGSGKSTMMNLIGCLDTPSSGRYELNGTNVSEMDDNQLAEVRNREIGFVFQTFNLLPRSNALHNEGLENKADFAVADFGQLIVIHLTDVGAVKFIAPGRGRVETTDEVHHRG